MFRETDTGSIGVLSDFSKPRSSHLPVSCWEAKPQRDKDGTQWVGTVIWLLTVTWAAQGPSCSRPGQGAGRTLLSCKSNPNIDP